MACEQRLMREHGACGNGLQRLLPHILEPHCRSIGREMRALRPDFTRHSQRVAAGDPSSRRSSKNVRAWASRSCRHRSICRGHCHVIHGVSARYMLSHGHHMCSRWRMCVRRRAQPTRPTETRFHFAKENLSSSSGPSPPHNASLSHIQTYSTMLNSPPSPPPFMS